MILRKTKAFKRDEQKIKMSDKHFTKLIEALYCLAQTKPLPAEFNDHALIGEWSDFRECHISGDLLLIYQVGDMSIKLVRLGSHNQLFKG